MDESFFDSSPDGSRGTSPTRTISEASPRRAGPSGLFQNIDESITDQIIVTGSSKKSSVYQVVEGLIPEELQSQLVKDFSEYERHEIFHRIDAYQADCDHVRPKALWIFGPPAVGKSTMCQEREVELFGWPGNVVTVDGAEFRVVHKGFQMVAQHGLRNNLLHADAWKMLKGSGFMDKMKEAVVDHAISNRQNLKIPETAVSTSRVDRMLENLVAAGYELHAMSLWAPKCETEARGRPRGVKEGKAFTTKEYSKASKNALSYGKMWQERMDEGSQHFKSVMFYDNTVFPSRPIHITEFKRLTEMTDEESKNYAKNAKAHRCAHIQSDIAASQARAQGQDHKQVVDAAISAWMKWQGESTATQSSALEDWGVSNPLALSELVQGERRRGYLQGLFAGVLLSIAAIAVKSSMMPRIWRQ